MPEKPGLGPNVFFAPTLPVKLGLSGALNRVPVALECRYAGEDAVDIPVDVGLNGLAKLPVALGLIGREEYDLEGLRGRAVGRSARGVRVGWEFLLADEREEGAV